jgi:ATP-dependent Clp protease ATP-binding subunit ClpC
MEKVENKSKTPMLENFGRDITRLAEEGKLDPVVGRKNEIERIEQILSRRKKNNPVLIGEPGVGKSAIAEGLAIRILEKKVSRTLFDKRVIALDIASIVAGTKYRGQFEERMKAILDEITKNPNIILFIDEIHTIVGAGNSAGAMDASNMLKPALARGELQCIGATTLGEYRKYIEKDGALERRFQKVVVEPTTAEETVEILKNIKSRYEDHHLVEYTDDAIKACVSLTNRYITDRFFPDKAIDALDEAGSSVHITNVVVPQNITDLENEIQEVRNSKKESIAQQKFEDAAEHRDKERKLIEDLEIAQKKWLEDSNIKREPVTEENVAKVVSLMTGVPIEKVTIKEGSKLLKMEDDLNAVVIGQTDAVKKVVKSIRRNRAGLKDPNRPIGTFMFLGATGVGKTFLAKNLAKIMFDNPDALVRIDMSEYMEKHTVSKLIGAPPGYVGYDEGGQLTEKIRRRPYSIILLDEIEKAHPDIFHILLQVLDDGVLTDSFGRRVDFKNTIIIMTSNIGSRKLKDFGQGVGFVTSAKKASAEGHSKGVIDKELKKNFSPEFLNRVDEVIVFDSLEKEDIFKIIDIEMGNVYKRLKDMNVNVEVTTKAKDFIVEKGWDENFGARPLKRAISKYVEDPLSEEIIKSNLAEGDTIVIDYETNSEDINVTVKKKELEKKVVKRKKQGTEKLEPEIFDN